MTDQSTEAKRHLHARCTACDRGYYVIYDSRPVEALGVRVAYLRCNKCNAKPEQNRVEFALSDRPARPKPDSLL